MAYQITEKCIGCTLCKKKCPVEAISGDVKKQHTINSERCIDCGVCGMVCSKSAVLNAEGILQEKQDIKVRPKPDIDKSACSACNICVNTCLFSCLEISKPQEKGDIDVFAILTDPAKCVGCGLCAERCPLDAIQFKITEETI